MVIVATVEYLRSRPIRIAKAISAGLQRFVSVVVAAFLVTTFTWAPFSLLAVPEIGLLLAPILMLVIASMLLVTVPAVVMEQKGPLAALCRSNQLTKGYKLPICLAMISMGAIMSGLNFCLALVQPDVITVGGEGTNLGMNLLWLAINSATMILGSILFAVLSAIFYVRVRDEREGTALNELASVFQ